MMNNMMQTHSFEHVLFYEQLINTVILTMCLFCLFFFRFSKHVVLINTFKTSIEYCDYWISCVVYITIT